MGWKDDVGLPPKQAPSATWSTTMSASIARVGFRYRKPRPVIARSDPLKQAAHKKLHLLANDETVDLWAMDEVHFQQYASRCRMWVPPEVKDPVLQHHPTRKSVGYFGAVRLRDGKFIFARELNRF